MGSRERSALPRVARLFSSTHTHVWVSERRGREREKAFQFRGEGLIMLWRKREREREWYWRRDILRVKCTRAVRLYTRCDWIFINSVRCVRIV